jgi:hypothetical protein
MSEGKRELVAFLGLAIDAEQITLTNGSPPPIGSLPREDLAAGALANRLDSRSLREASVPPTNGSCWNTAALPIGRTARKVLQSQTLRYKALALVLPTLLVAPGHAGMLLLHEHCDESTHFHRFDHAAPNAWRDDHARQHPCEGPGRRDSHEPEAAVGDADCDHDTPFLVLAKEHLSRPLRSRDSDLHGQTLAASTAIAVFPAAPEQDLTSGPPPPSISRTDLLNLDATAALLLRNHALLL